LTRGGVKRRGQSLERVGWLSLDKYCYTEQTTEKNWKQTTERVEVCAGASLAWGGGGD